MTVSIQVGSVCNTRIRNGWEKWTVTDAEPYGNDTVLSFMGRKNNGKIDPSRTGTLFFASDFKYNSKNGEYYEIQK